MILEIVASLISAGIGFVALHFRKKKRKAFAELLLEGASLSDVPSLRDLLTNTAARDAIKAHVVAIGFEPGFKHDDGMSRDSAPEDVFLVDDGGGVHSLDTSSTPRGILESEAAELARLFGVEFRS